MDYRGVAMAQIVTAEADMVEAWLLSTPTISTHVKCLKRTELVMALVNIADSIIHIPNRYGRRQACQVMRWSSKFSPWIPVLGCRHLKGGAGAKHDHRSGTRVQRRTFAEPSPVPRIA
jgi:hypothetical protein